jgi:carbon monoxide dehydrogenase subunit G
VIQARPGRVWKLIQDPHHMPRWWPGVRRMEGVDGDRFTQVHYSRRGRPVRMDFRVIASEAPRRRVWEQELVGTPFERVLSQAVTEVQLEPAGEGTQVTIVLTQKLRGLSRTGGFMFRRATRKKLDEALEGLARVC